MNEKIKHLVSIVIAAIAGIFTAMFVSGKHREAERDYSRAERDQREAESLLREQREENNRTRKDNERAAALLKEAKDILSDK